MGVAATVVVVAAASIGPTNKFHKSSTLRVRAVVRAEGFGIIRPWQRVVDVGIKDEMF